MRTQNGKKTSQPGISRLAEKKWWIRVTVRDPATGRKKERTQMLDNVEFREARREQEAMRASLESELSADAVRPQQQRCDLTLTEYAQRWLVQARTTQSHRPHVLARVAGHLEVHVLPFVGKVRLDQVNAQVLSRWAAKLVGARKANGRPYATETLRSTWQTLRMLLNDARMLVGFKVDLEGFQFRARGTPPREKDVLEQAELHAVLREAYRESPDMCAMIWLGFTTGMRFGELSALTWKEVDLERGIVVVRHSQVGGHVGTTKTGKTRRVTMVPQVVEQLRALPAWQAREGIEAAVPGLVFPARSGLHRAPATLAKPLAACARRAEVNKHVTPHTMRRTANNLLRQYAGEIAARAMVGHSTTAMTEHYSQVTMDEKRDGQQRALGSLPQNPDAGHAAGKKPGPGVYRGGYTHQDGPFGEECATG